jgi:hypothetical protein
MGYFAQLTFILGRVGNSFSAKASGDRLGAENPKYFSQIAPCQLSYKCLVLPICSRVPNTISRE